MIPKHIFSIWLNDKSEMPELISKCLASQPVPGYTYHLVTLYNCDKTSEYVIQALENKKWAKAADYLRMQYLYNYGGIYLDADMEVLKDKNFDDLLNYRLFTYFECCGLYANMGIGSEPQHPMIGDYLKRVEDNYKGTGDLTFEPGIRTWHDICWAADKTAFTMIPPEIFCPYNHATGTVNVTPLTKVYHYYSKSWLPNNAPK
jgi:mannosyltransferase OCH1-like enzyme